MGDEASGPFDAGTVFPDCAWLSDQRFRERVRDCFEGLEGWEALGNVVFLYEGGYEAVR